MRNYLTALANLTGRSALSQSETITIAALIPPRVLCRGIEEVSPTESSDPVGDFLTASATAGNATALYDADGRIDAVTIVEPFIGRPDEPRPARKTWTITRADLQSRRRRVTADHIDCMVILYATRCRFKGLALSEIKRDKLAAELGISTGAASAALIRLRGARQRVSGRTRLTDGWLAVTPDTTAVDPADSAEHLDAILAAVDDLPDDVRRAIHRKTANS